MLLVLRLVGLPDLHGQPGVEFCEVEAFLAVGPAVLPCCLEAGVECDFCLTLLLRRDVFLIALSNAGGTSELA